jgi:pimeloyl-ACP methyl ester carboxylesterase
MRLAVHESGGGSRTAVLIHGLMSDHRAWHRVSADLERAGFRIVAVDLAGHGGSPRAARYSPAAWAADVLETVAPLLGGAPDLLMGHSLGGLVASLIADALHPRAAVYVDPAFGFPGGVRGVLLKLLFAVSPRPRRASLVRMNPKWDAIDLEIELATLADWDKRTLLGLARTRGLVPPARVTIPSLAVLAERSWLVSDAVAEVLRERGMTVRRMAGAGHTVFRDEHRDFMTAVQDWLDRVAPAPALGPGGSDRT